MLSFIIKAHSEAMIHVHRNTSINRMMHYRHEEKYNIRAKGNELEGLIYVGLFPIIQSSREYSSAAFMWLC